jgi:hypothetical protein
VNLYKAKVWAMNSTVTFYVGAESYAQAHELVDRAAAMSLLEYNDKVSEHNASVPEAPSTPDVLMAGPLGPLHMMFGPRRLETAKEFIIREIQLVTDKLVLPINTEVEL